MQQYNYAILKNFQRVKSINEIFQNKINKNILEDTTIIKIKENINNYKKKELIRLRKLEILNQLIDKVEAKIIQNKFRKKHEN